MGRRIWIQEKTRENPNKRMGHFVYNTKLSELADCSLKSIKTLTLGVAVGQALVVWRRGHLHMESRSRLSGPAVVRGLGRFTVSPAARKSVHDHAHSHIYWIRLSSERNDGKENESGAPWGLTYGSLESFFIFLLSQLCFLLIIFG